MYAILDQNNICIAMVSDKTGFEKYVKTEDNVLGMCFENNEWVSPKVIETQLDRIESAVSNTLDEIRAEAVDAYTLSLIENNII